MTRTQSTVIGIISFLAVLGLSTPAITFAWVGGDMMFSNIGNIYMPGYTVPGMNAMPSSYGNSYGQYSAPQQSGAGFRWTTSTYPARAFDPMVDTFYYPQQSYGMNSSGYGGSSYSSYGSGYGSNYGSYPQMSYDPYYGYSAAFGPSYATGDYDLLGTPLCQWYDYNGATPCAYDPHQRVYDQYTGTWY